jgi:hypothetical protein
MPDPTGDKDNLPPWILPYVRSMVGRPTLSSDALAIFVGVVIGEIAESIQDSALKQQLKQAGSRFTNLMIDECGSTGPHKPHPPKGFSLVADQLQGLSDSAADGRLRAGLHAAAGALQKSAQA